MNGEHELEAVPTRPYKAIASVAVAVLTSILYSEANLPIYAEVGIGAALAGLAVFIIPNPVRAKKKVTTIPRDNLFLGE